MKIKHITMVNVGPYKTNASMNFDFSNDKNITLIGGKNGAGKTTLFKSIQFCLYGARALGYEINTPAYFKEIKKLLNINLMLSSGEEAKVTVVISLENSTDCNDYIVSRMRNIKNDKIIEKLDITHDDTKLSDEEISNFENLMLQLVPPDLFNFYFFDGEKIFETLFNENSTSNFKNSFVKIIGVDTLDILIENFEKHAVEKNISKKTLDAYEKARRLYISIKEQKEEIELQISNIDEQILVLEDEFKQMKKKFSKRKVISQSERIEIENELKHIEGNRDKIRRFLKDSFNNIIPFILLKEQLKELLNELTSSKSLISKKDLLSVLQTSNSMKVIKETINIDANLFLNNLINSIFEDNTSSNLELSSGDKTYLINQVSEILMNLKVEEIRNAEEEYKKFLDRAKELRAILEENMGDRNEELTLYELDYSKKIITLTKEKEKLFINIAPIIDKYSQIFNEYKKTKQNYEAELKTKSVSLISYSASKSFLELRNKIVDSKIDLLKEKFIINFNKLINKENLISGIIIDDELNVYPYKEIELSYLEVTKMLSSSNTKLLIEQYGEDGFELMKHLSPDKCAIVNKRILGTLSAGESQIYVIALYMAMIQLSTINIPIIIDTPFGRTDEDHRTNIIDNFMKVMPNQTIILSTDEEIEGDLYERICENVSNKYTLRNKGTLGTLISNGYFERGV